MLGTCHYSARGGGHFFGGRVIIFPFLSGGGSQFFSRLFGEGHNYFKVIFLENKELTPCCSGSWFSLLTYFTPSVKEKMSRGQKQNDL